MKLREQLRQQAAAVEQKNTAQAGQESSDEQIYREQLLPALRAAARYFTDVVNDLEIIRQTLRFCLPMGPQTSPEVKFRQSSYRIAIDDEEQTREIMVSARCELTSVLTRRIDDLRSANSYEEMLRERGLSFFRRRSEHLSGPQLESSHFTVEGAMSCGFTLRADLANRRIQVRTHNLEDRPVREHPLAPQRVDESLFESLGRLLLREQDQLLFTEVSDEMRQKLRERVRSGERWVPEVAAATAGRTTAVGRLKQQAAALLRRAARLFHRRR